jgi:hypothetical protein
MDSIAPPIRSQLSASVIEGPVAQPVRRAREDSAAMYLMFIETLGRCG